MSEIEEGRVLTDQALVSDQAATHLDPTGFDPSRGDVILRKEVFDFLMGEGAYDGTWFGDLNAGLPGRFWWRAVLRAAQRESAQGTEARRAETAQQGSVHDGPVANGDAPKSSPETTHAQ
jgi:hypothetical protein